VIYRLMQAGERDEIAARSDVLLLAGEAAALEYTIDGRPARSLGASGAVRTARITRDNARTSLQ
jgi:RodZ C-terminal domain